MIYIHQRKNSIYFLLGHIFSVVLSISLKQLIILKLSIFVSIKLHKHLLKPCGLLLGYHVLDHHAHGGLLQLLSCAKP